MPAGHQQPLDGIPPAEDFFDQMPDFEPPEWADTGSARREEKEWTKLDEVLEKNDVRWVGAYGWIVLVIAWVFAGIFVATLIAWTLQYLLPEKWIWLTDKQLNKVQAVLFSGGMGAVISSVIKRQMDRISSSKRG